MRQFQKKIGVIGARMDTMRTLTGFSFIFFGFFLKTIWIEIDKVRIVRNWNWKLDLLFRFVKRIFRRSNCLVQKTTLWELLEKFMGSCAVRSEVNLHFVGFMRKYFSHNELEMPGRFLCATINSSRRRRPKIV